MSVPRKRREHSPIFKAKVALEALEGRKTIRELGLEHGVHPNLITHWKNRILDRLPEFFQEGLPRPDGLAAEREATYINKIGRLTMELDLIKKKSGLDD